jgi:hypothetical protein
VPAPVDHFKFGMMSTAVVQDSTRTSSIVLKQAGRHWKALEHVTLFTNGEAEAVAPAFRLMGTAVRKGLTSVLPKAGRLATGVAATIEASAPVFKVLTKYCQIITLPFVAVDVWLAVREQDPAKKRGAAVNAAITAISGATGIVGIWWWASAAGLPSLVVSIACGAFQLVDALACDGKMTHWLGQKLLGWWHPTPKAKP